MKKLFYIILFLSFFICYPSNAKDRQQYFFQQVNLENGLSSFIPCVAVSDETGYVWISTRLGIECFDGYKVKKYPLHHTTHLLEDEQNKLWAISAGKLYYYNENEDRFVLAKDSEENEIRAESFCLWSDGVILSSSNTIYKYEYMSGSIKRLAELQSNYYLKNIQPWDEETLLGTDRYETGKLLNIKTGEVKSTPFNSHNFSACLIDSEGNTWGSTYNQGLKCYNKDGKLIDSFNINNSILKSNVILHLIECKGKIWVATDGAGIYVLNPKTRYVTELKRIPGDIYSLPVNTILYLCSDARGSVWAGTVRGGLINIKETSMKTYTDAFPGGSYGLSDKTVLSICQDSKDDIWIGLDGGGLNRFDSTKENFKHFPTTQGDKIVSIIDIDANRLLVSLFNEGIFFFNKEMGKYIPLVIENDSVNNSICKQGESVNLLRDAQGDILFLSKHPYKYNVTKNSFTPITYDRRNELVGVFRSVCNDSTYSLLFDYKKLFRMGENNNLERILTFSDDVILNSISLDEHGTIWIGSNKGLSYYNTKNKQLTEVPYHLITEVNSLICDKRGTVWLGSNQKLFAYRIKDGDFILYGESDGVLINEYLERPRLLANDGKVYMGGVNGLLCVNKQQFEKEKKHPTLRLNDVSVSGERVNVRLSNNKKLKVVETETLISVSMIAGNKDIFQKPLFCYRLQGETEEITYSYQPEITFNRLPVGSYKLLASCSTRKGGWSEESEIITLEIIPIWYKSTWFVTTLSFIALCILSLFLFLLFKRKDRNLMWMIKEKEQETYKEKLDFLINMNHELRTPLTLIHAPLKHLLNEIEKTDANYAIIKSICNQSDRMKRLLNAVLDIHKMEIVQSSLKIESVDINSWIEELLEDFKPEAGERGITLKFLPTPMVTTTSFDKEKSTTILTNLLINAVKYTDSESCVTVAVSLIEEEQAVRISVSDQGAGLKNIDLNHLFTRFYQGISSKPGTGIGLSYSKILIEQQGGKIDAYNNQDGRGATFWFQIPLHLVEGEIILQPQSYLTELLSFSPDQNRDTVSIYSLDELKNKTLLIVEDNEELADYLYTTFRVQMKQVWVATNGKEALSICQEFKPSIVVSDIHMPEMNGYELCKAIKEDIEISHIPVVLLTACGDKASEMFGYKNGADAYLTKPFEIDVLYTILCSQLKNRDRIRTCYTGEEQLPVTEAITFSAADEAFLNKLNQLITDNLNNERLGVPFLSTELAVSRSSLYNKLKALTNMGVNDYITKFRIDQAIKLLLQNELPINEVSDVVGFSTPRYFSTVFKQHTGLSPTQYKKKKGF